MNPTLSKARQLRRNQTDVERLLWRGLRLWQVDGYKFRHHQPLGNYIVDFLCLQKRVIIEVAGGQHAQEKNHDAEWDAWLREQGFIILRFGTTMCLRISTE